MAYDPSSEENQHIRKIVKATSRINLYNPQFVTEMKKIRDGFGKNWKFHEEHGDYTAWDNAILAVYNKLSPAYKTDEKALTGCHTLKELMDKFDVTSCSSNFTVIQLILPDGKTKYFEFNECLKEYEEVNPL
jgi:hypothetical protein